MSIQMCDWCTSTLYDTNDLQCAQKVKVCLVMTVTYKKLTKSVCDCDMKEYEQVSVGHVCMNMYDVSN